MTRNRSHFRPPNPTSSKASRCARIIGEETSVLERRKQCDSSCSKETNIGSGWEQKSTRQRYPFTFTIPTASWRKNLTAGRKATLRPHMLYQKQPAVILSS